MLMSTASSRIARHRMRTFEHRPFRMNSERIEISLVPRLEERLVDHHGKRTAFARTNAGEFDVARKRKSWRRLVCRGRIRCRGGKRVDAGKNGSLAPGEEQRRLGASQIRWWLRSIRSSRSSCWSPRSPMRLLRRQLARSGFPQPAREIIPQSRSRTSRPFPEQACRGCLTSTGMPSPQFVLRTQLKYAGCGIHAGRLLTGPGGFEEDDHLH